MRGCPKKPSTISTCSDLVKQGDTGVYRWYPSFSISELFKPRRNNNTYVMLNTNRAVAVRRRMGVLLPYPVSMCALISRNLPLTEPFEKVDSYEN